MNSYHFFCLSFSFLSLLLHFTHGAVPQNIKIDGDFSDWAEVPSYFDPHDVSNGSTVDCGLPKCIPDNHLAMDEGYNGSPTHVYNPGADILEYKFTHDSSHFYTYIRTAGHLCNMSRCYVVTSLNIDANTTTGCWLHEGGFYPTSQGYDFSYEIEFINGTYNQGDAVYHDINNVSQFEGVLVAQLNSILNVAPGNYHNSSQWVTWDAGKITSAERSHCANLTNKLNASVPAGPYTLRSGEEICFTQDLSPGPFYGQIKFAQDSTATLIEISCPWSIFMSNSQGRPNIYSGQTLDIAISIEIDNTTSTPHSWASDTGGATILRYTLDSTPTEAASSAWIESRGGNALMFFFGLGVGSLIFGCIYLNQKYKREKGLLEAY